MKLVLDACVTVAWLFADERSDISRSALRQVAKTGAVVPSLWKLEVANVLQKAVQRGRCDEVYASRSLSRLAQMDIIVDSETDRHAWGETRRLALEHRLTLYDAAYLELAIRLSLPLASHDGALIRAAQETRTQFTSDLAAGNSLPARK